MTNPRMTVTDIAWSAVFLLLFLPLLATSVFSIFLAYFMWLDPTTSSQGLWMVFGIALDVLAVSLAVLIALALFGLLTRRFLSPQDYARWMLQYQNSPFQSSFLGASWQRIFFRIVRPRNE